MKITYVAKHDSGGNDEEGAIYHALTQLGHEVDRIEESRGRKASKAIHGSDLLLFHKWYDPDLLKSLEGKTTRVFWHWDLVDWPDPSLQRRCAHRVQWMQDIVPNVEVGFCSDGDWVHKDHSAKLFVLQQGVDERYKDTEPVYSYRSIVPILFTGITKGGGEGRQEFVNDMQTRWGSMFRQVANGVHGQELINLISNSMIVVAPDSPVSNRYWSNRVYLTLGFGGFLLHPYCYNLSKQYEDGKEIVFYRNREELHYLIKHYLEHREERGEIAARGKIRTYNEHTYRHRCERMLRTIKLVEEDLCPQIKKTSSIRSTGPAA